MAPKNNDNANDDGNGCQSLINRRQKCYSKHGEKNEKCCVPKLEAKRCLAFKYCQLEALQYYGHNNDHTQKSSCGAYNESACFGNPRIMKIDNDKDQFASPSKAKDNQASSSTTSKSSSKKQLKIQNEKVFEHHQKAKRKVLGNRQKFRDCQEITRRLDRCLVSNIR